MPEGIQVGGRLKVTVDKVGRAKMVALLNGVIFRDDSSDSWISFCPSLDLYTCAPTEQEILKNTKEAITLFLESCMQMGTLDKALRELNWVREDEIDVAGLARHKAPKTPPAFIVEELKRHDRGWEARAVSNF